VNVESGLGPAAEAGGSTSETLDRGVVPRRDPSEEDVGEKRARQLQVSAWSGVIGASLAPKSIVRSVICWIPPPLPIGP
jgi:hypothetical protein